MMRQTFLKLAAFIGLGAAIPTKVVPVRRQVADTSIPQAKTGRRTPHGRMRLFRSYR